MITALYIFLGGGLGALLRYFISLAIPVKAFPVGTLFCNLLGCFLIGFLAGVIPKPSPLQVALTVGVLGGFTTFSSFSDASLKLFQQGNAFMFFFNLGASVIGGITLTYLGYRVSEIV